MDYVYCQVFYIKLPWNAVIVNTNKKDRKESVKQHLRNYANHKESFNAIKSNNGTTLSIEYWNLKQKQEAERFIREIKGQCKAYSHTLKKWNLCLNEKLVVIDNPDKK